VFLLYLLLYRLTLVLRDRLQLALPTTVQFSENEYIVFRAREVLIRRECTVVNKLRDAVQSQYKPLPSKIRIAFHVTTISHHQTTMSVTEEIEVPPLPPPIPQAPRPPRKLKPARKQVKPGDVNKTETIQTGKEYSEFYPTLFIARNVVDSIFIDIWYNKWAGGDREDNYSKYVANISV